MVRVLSLVWTFFLALAVTAVSFFYIVGADKHGFPFWFARDSVSADGTSSLAVNYVSILLDTLVWWFLFSLTWLVIKNYVLELD